MMKWYRNIKISAKLIIGFLLIAAIGAGMGILGIANINDMAKADKELYKENTLGVAYASSAGTYFQRIRYNALEMTILKTDDDRKANVDKINTFADTIDDLLAKYKDRITLSEDQNQFDILETDWNLYKGYISEITKAVDRGDIDRAEQIILVDSDKSGTDFRTVLENILAYNEKLAENDSKSNTRLAADTTIEMIIIILLGAIISVLLGIFISKSISKPVKKIVEAADKLAQGDVDVNTENNRRDEIGELSEAFEKMVSSIRSQALALSKIADGDMTVDIDVRSDKDILGRKLYELVHNNNELLSSIATSSEQVAVGAKQVSDAGISLSEGATEQASSVEELTASLEQISSQTDLNAQNANQANQLAETAKNNAIQGNNQMKEMLTAIEEINVASSNISKVIKVIDDIAFQTNILALNAAVEAARAGQHGKGFAVVAEEVRNLAARSANAAKETTDMIEGSIKKAESGSRIARDTADALNKIVTEIERVANLVKDIATASNEQALGISQINQGIMQVSQVVQTNSATSEESASASEELSSQAAMLKDTISRYKLKKNTRSNFGKEDISPEVLMMLENMQNSKNYGKDYGKVSKADNISEVPAKNPKIVLNDKEFGKY